MPETSAAPTLADRLAALAAELESMAARRSSGRGSYCWLTRAATDVQYALADVRNEDGDGVRPGVRLTPLGLRNGHRLYVETDG